MFIARIPRNAPPPVGAARARAYELMPGVIAVCSTYHVVLEGDGFGAAIRRGILTGLFQLSWRRKTFFVHNSASEVAGSVGTEQQRAVSAILQLAAARGLLSGPAPESLFPKPTESRDSGHQAR